MSRKSSTAFTSLSDLTAALGQYPNMKVRVGKSWAEGIKATLGVTIPLEVEAEDETPATAPAKSASKATATVS